MRATRMALCALAAGGGVGAACVWLGRWQFVIGIGIIALAVVAWGLARNIRPRRELWIPPMAQPTLVFDTEPRDRSGNGCGRCGHPGFLEHRCVDGTIVPGLLESLVDRGELRDLAGTWPFAVGAPE